MTRRLVALVALAGLGAATLACGDAPRPAKGAPASVPQAVALVALGHDVAGEVTRLRGLAALRPIELRSTPEADFERALVEDAVALDGEAARPAAQTRAAITLAYYRRADRVVYVRERMPTWALAAEVTPAEVLAHEITHALQDEHFSIFDDPKADYDHADALVARRALIEGDAMLVQAAYHAAHEGRPVKRALVSLGAVEAEASPQTLIRLGLFSPALLEVPAARQLALMFPYIQGEALAAALYRTGGFALIDRAHRAPPQTTMHVFDPAAWVAGVRATPVGALPVPRGATVKTDQSFGALAVLGFLRACGVAAGPELARPWRGGRVTVAKSAAVELTLAITTWDTEADAARFEEAVRKCVGRGEPGLASREHALRSGTAVALVSGVAGDVGPIAQHMYEAVGAAPERAPPFGALSLVAPPVSLGRRLELHGAVTGDVYASAWLAVRARVPQGFRSKTELANVQLMVAAGPGTVGGFMIEAAHGARAAAGMHDAMAIGMQASAGGKLVKLGTAEARTRLGAGTSVDWALRFAEGDRRIRTVVVRACDGVAAYAWVLSWTGAERAPELEQWVDSFEPTSAPSQACRQLVEEATVDLP